MTSLAQPAASAVGAGTSIALAYPSTNTSGNLLVGCVGTGQAGTVITGVADSKSQTWSLAAKITSASAIEASEWYFPNCGAGANTVTASFSASVDCCIGLLEYQGCATSSPLDQTNTGANFGSNPITGDITTTQADEVIVGCACHSQSGNSFTPGSGYTEQVDTGSTRPLHVQDQIVSATGTYHSSETSGSVGNWAAVIASFKGGPPSQQYGFYRKKTYRPRPFSPGMVR